MRDTHFTFKFTTSGTYDQVYAEADARCKEFFQDHPYTFDLFIEQKQYFNKGYDLVVEITAYGIEDSDGPI